MKAEELGGELKDEEDTPWVIAFSVFSQPRSTCET